MFWLKTQALKTHLFLKILLKIKIKTNLINHQKNYITFTGHKIFNKIKINTIKYQNHHIF